MLYDDHDGRLRVTIMTTEAMSMETVNGTGEKFSLVGGKLEPLLLEDQWTDGPQFRYLLC